MAKRRSWSDETMRRIVEEAISEGNFSLVARRYGLDRSVIRRWVARYREGWFGDGETLPASATDRLIEENRQLKRILGEKELQVKIMEDLLKKTVHRQGTKLR